MALLPAGICDALSLPQGSTTDQLLELLRGGSHDYLDGLILTEDGRQAAIEALAMREAYDIRVLPQIGRIQERYCTVMFNDYAVPVLVGLLSKNPSPQLPTALENLVFWVLMDSSLQWHAVWKETDSGVVSDWRRLAADHAILATPKGMGGDGLRLICAMFGLQHGDIGAPSPVNHLLHSVASVSVGASSTSFTVMQARLLSEAEAVHHPKWRCLSLYRVLEHAYLNNIKRTLLESFDTDATKALDEAKVKLASEVNQLVALAQEADLKNEFVAFDEAFEAQLAASNRFILGLDRAAQGESLYRSTDRYKKAVLRFYKLRCSIAHAGTSSVIYEQFSDADHGVTALLPLIETIALKSLKMVA